MPNVTVLERLCTALRTAAQFNRSTQAAPAAILWPDHKAEWQAILPRLRAELPELLTLGPYAPADRSGPALWLKCMLARTLPEADWHAETVPVIYLPGISRADLRAIESCPRTLQPIAELQYRGVFWSQVNGKDWTVNALLTSERGGFSLDVAQDTATQTAMLRALAVLLDTTVTTLQGRRLEAADFDRLLLDDPIRDVLRWLNDAPHMTTEWAGSRWQAFVGRCQEEFGIYPEQDGALAAAEHLVSRAGVWAEIWIRYSETCSHYPQLPALLERLRPPADLFADRSAYPQVNDERENTLRTALLALPELPPAAARQRLLALEQEHSERRQWLWAQLKRAPLALALEPLARLAAGIAQPLGGASPDDMAACYRESHWQIDAWALDSLAAVSSPTDTEAVSNALQAIYVPWLDAAAHRLQELVKQQGYPGKTGIAETTGDYATGGCVLFVDGLRYDLAHRLAECLTERGLQAHLSSLWSSVPSVTASGKAWVAPIAAAIIGQTGNSDFTPSRRSTNQPLSTQSFRKLLEETGWQVLPSQEHGDPQGRAWAEFGDLDHFGHEHGLRLAREASHQLDSLSERISQLLEAGWQRVRVVTDHGWLLVPGRLPKIELPKYLTETRWGRCATLKDASAATALTLGWSWCAEVSIAMAPGIGSFIAGADYAHGGLSLQECVTPVIDITPATVTMPRQQAQITQAKWTGLRCRLEAQGELTAVTADLRLKPADAATSLLSQPRLLTDGKASLVVADDERAAQAAFIVLLDRHQQVIAKMTTVIGGDA